MRNLFLRDISINEGNGIRSLFHPDRLASPVICRLWLFSNGGTVTAAGFFYELLGFASGDFRAGKSDYQLRPVC